MYFIIRNNYLKDIRLNIFPYLKLGFYRIKKKQPKTKHFITKSIDFRPIEANERLEYGHLEVDTVEGKKDDFNNIVSMLDRKSSRLSLTLYEGKFSNNFLEATKNNLSNFPSDLKSITSDNGIENAKINFLTNNWFATRAYASYEKGSVEQKHKQFRKFFPKGKSFKNITKKHLDKICLIINVKTYLQKGKRSTLGKIVTEEEIEIFKNLLI